MTIYADTNNKEKAFYCEMKLNLPIRRELPGIS